MAAILSRRNFLATTGLACGTFLPGYLSSQADRCIAEDVIKPGTGTFKGVVKFAGDVPARKLVIKKDDPTLKPEDRAICAAEDYFSEELLVNERAGNGVANVFLYLRNAPAGYEPKPVPEQPFILDVKTCRYSPHAFVLRCGQTLKVKAHDAVPHNAHIRSLRNPQFSEVISARDADGIICTRIFKKPESRPVSVVCDLHTWMKAYYLVLDHDLAAVTTGDGQFMIKGLPPGKHSFMVWHEIPGWLKKELVVEIKPDVLTETSLSFEARDFEHPK